jgi:hypothetical protein
MRKFTVTAFAVLYGVLIVSTSAERAGDWAIKEAEALTHHQTVHGYKTLGKSGKPDSHLQQTRLLENGFVVELPKEAAATLAPSQRHTHRLSADFYLSSFARLISSRAPPFLT